MALSSGEKLGPYEIRSPLAAVGMGEVYRARDTRLDRDVAIKVACSTIRKYKRYLSRWALPRWGTTPALAVHPPDVEDWLRELKKKFELRNSTLGEIRKAMNNVYVHGQRQAIAGTAGNMKNGK